MPGEVRDLQFDATNIPHLAANGLEPSLIWDIVLSGSATISVDPRPGRSATHHLVGEDTRGRLWTVAVLEVDTESRSLEANHGLAQYPQEGAKMVKRRLSRDEEARLVDEAQRAHDSDTALDGKVMIPVRSPQSAVLSARVPKAVFQAVAQRAALRRTSISVLIREMVETLAGDDAAAIKGNSFVEPASFLKMGEDYGNLRAIEWLVDEGDQIRVRWAGKERTVSGTAATALRRWLRSNSIGDGMRQETPVGALD